MPPDLTGALEDGSLTWEDVDRSVVRTMATLLRFNHLLDRPRPDSACWPAPSIGRWPARRRPRRWCCCATSRSREAPLLPLDPDSLRRVAVIGRLADLRNLGDGGSSDVWAPEVVTPLEGLRAALPGVDVGFDDGTDVARAAALAGAAEVALVVVGYTKADEGEFIGVDNSLGPSARPSSRSR